MGEARWKPKMLPPYWVGIGLVALAALHRWLPGPQLLDGAWRWLGIVPIVGGGLLALWAEHQFRRAGTGVIPGSDINAFVHTGPYRHVRNPMYIGMTLALLGCVLLLGTATGLVVPLAFVVVIDRRFVRREEAMLERRFGESAWRAYESQARRWL